ncbi:MAG: 2-oxo acid dehydrogenase subunit E2 [Acidimicrobiia bacterium]|nr:2-oxo acid dehydrogenase subunit E2 [Acidimicrobiia bacterium]
MTGEPAPTPTTATPGRAAPTTTSLLIASTTSAPTPEQGAEPAGEEPAAEPLRGAAARVVRNMTASLEVPTATSFRDVPAKLLEVNRKVINGYRERSGQGKVSFTHLIGYAIVRAIADAVPSMNNTFHEGADGKPRLVTNEHVNMGLAVDVDKGDGSRTLVVPVLRDADTLDFAEFLAAYEEIIRKVRNNKLTLDDFQGANVTLTNPGTIGTVQSVPRLMPGQGVIVGVGNIDYPAEFEGADRSNLSSLGVSKVVTITSTYDHRIIQGAESGLFLKRVHELLLGEHGFYERDLPPRSTCRTNRSSGVPTRTRSTARRRCCTSRCRSPSSSECTGCAATCSPTSTRCAGRSPTCTRRARPGHLRADDLGPRPRVPHRLASGRRGRRDAASATCSACCATPTAARSASSTCTSRTPRSSAGSRARSKVHASR